MRSTYPMSRGSLSMLLAAAVFAISAIAGTATASASCAFNCFAAADGNQATGDQSAGGDANARDWQDIAGSVTTLTDPAKGVDTKFAGGDKETQPGSWTFITGNNTPKTDILEGWANLESNVLEVAFVRAMQSGDTFLSFELNQQPAAPRPGTSDPVYPQRSEGDILFTYDISTTNHLSFGMCTWHGDANSGDWQQLDGTPLGGSVKRCTQLPSSGPPPIAEGAVNWGQSITGYLNPSHYNPIGAGKFGEAAVDFGSNDPALQAFLAGAIKNPCSPNGWVWMHSRAAEPVLSQPKDVLTGLPLTNPTCGLTIDKKESLSGQPGTFVDGDVAHPLAATVGDTIHYAITVSNTGTADLTVDVSDPRCDAGTLSGPGGLDGQQDPLAAGTSTTYTCTHVVQAGDADSNGLFTNEACTTGTATAGDNSVTLGLDPAICDSAVAEVFQPGQLASGSGTKFLDANGNGVHDGGESGIGGFVFYVDYNGNGTLDPGEPAAASAADGTWTISGIRPGSYSVREVADPNFNCTVPAAGDGCKYDATFTGGQNTSIGEFGNAPKPQQQTLPDQAGGGSNPGSQVVLGERITPGSARLLGATGCVSRAFNARIRGVKVAKVVFYLDGRRIKTLTRKNLAGTYAVRIDPRRLRIGVHRLVAKVTFQRGSATKPKTFRLAFQRCPRALRAPRFTG